VFGLHQTSADEPVEPRSEREASLELAVSMNEGVPVAATEDGRCPCRRRTSLSRPWKQGESAPTKGATMSLRKSTALPAGAAALVVAALALAACGGSSDSDATPKTAGGSPATIGVADGSLGKILVDSKGRTLYLFQKDAGRESTCFGECALNWPPLLVSGAPTEGSGANPALVGTSSRPGGKQQVTYNGHPLYLFEGDRNAGDTNGEGVNAFGGSWYALSPAGDEVAQPANGTGGYGY
jgi:predicted lipoprotein with Yx(FWY)xxD motif